MSVNQTETLISRISVGGVVLTGELETVNKLVGTIDVSRKSSGITLNIGSGLKLENNILSVDSADEVEQDNTNPITSGAVYKELGNIEALLANI